ncbi:hypothetical protein BS78_03G291100 [Paspalum vaginatum]|nr:hypothetical protein BS78_03G291100 [Paspalum vaginatum]
MAAAGLLDEKHPSSWADFIARVALVVLVSSGCLLISLLPGRRWGGARSDSECQPSNEFWVKLSGVEGLDRSSDALTAPAFHMILRVNNEGHGWQACGNGGRVDLPGFCLPPGLVSSVPFVATSEGIGLPDELYERMEAQRQRNERVSLDVHVRMDEVLLCGTNAVTGSYRSPLLLWCTAILHGQPKGPFLCQARCTA